MIQFRPLLIMTALAVLAFAAMLMVGRWQWDKYETKRAAAETPVPAMTIANYEPLPEGLQLVHGARAGEEGWRVFAPVRNGDQIVFVDSDFIPGAANLDWREVRFPAALRFGAPVSGASIRPDDRVSIVAVPSDPLARQWWKIDLQAMGRAAGLTNVADYYLASSYVGADGRAIANPFAVAAGADPLPPARHLGYALTWWGLALALVAIYFAYHVSVGRLKIVLPKHHD